MTRIATWTLMPLFLLFATLVTSGAAQAHEPQGQGPMGPGYGMGPGMMGPGMMGPGMMGPGMMGPGMMGPGMMGSEYGTRQVLPKDLSMDDIRHMLEHQLAWQGNPNLKLGNVKEKDDDTIIAEIVTKDGSLVDRLEVDRHTGQIRRAN